MIPACERPASELPIKAITWIPGPSITTGGDKLPEIVLSYTNWRSKWITCQEPLDSAPGQRWWSCEALRWSRPRAEEERPGELSGSTGAPDRVRAGLAASG